ncbi:APC family permease [Streptomyces bungoensis]
MTFGLATRKLYPKVVRRHGEGDKSHLTVVEGLAALSLDALSSVAYGPEAIMLTLAAAGAGAITAALPITLVIAGLLGVLVVSYCQVIAVHPDGGGSYAVAKKDLGTKVSLLAAAGLVVDYVLTVAVSLAAGAASLASAFPVLAHHSLAVCLGGLALLTAVNLWGIADSARVLLLPMVLFVVSVLGIVVVGLSRPAPAATVGTPESFHATEALGLLLLLKAFSAGCSALTGIEAVANAVPMFRKPRIRRAQRTELLLGVILGALLIGLTLVIHRHHVVPRKGVTVLAQLTAGAYGTGWAYYVTSVVVTLALGLAANTSFGGLPVLMSLLARDNRLPHLFALRAERPVHRYGVLTLAVLSCVLLIAVNADTQRLLPLFAVGVFVGFTISQSGLVRHWATVRPAGWAPRAVINGVGAVLTAVAAVVLLASKFLAGPGSWRSSCPCSCSCSPGFSATTRSPASNSDWGGCLRRRHEPPVSSSFRWARSTRLPSVPSPPPSRWVTRSWWWRSSPIRRKPPPCAPSGRAGIRVSASTSSRALCTPWCTRSSTTWSRPAATAGRWRYSSLRWSPPTAAFASCRTNAASCWPVC